MEAHCCQPAINKFHRWWRLFPLLLQLSYADTHPMFTSDSFPNFFRIVPSENAFNAPRFALLAQFNWTRVGTIYQNEPRYALVSRNLRFHAIIRSLDPWRCQGRSRADNLAFTRIYKYKYPRILCVPLAWNVLELREYCINHITLKFAYTFDIKFCDRNGPFA
jgi:hypothetical protein